jgi:ATP-dependent DNA helicase RecG
VLLFRNMRHFWYADRSGQTILALLLALARDPLLRVAAEIKGLRREEKWEYPLEGLREAVVNAICHRDYTSSANVQVRIFDDRLEVWNPGDLPEGMTVDDLRRPHESKPRNKLIANAFFLIKYIEQFGTGIQRILDDFRAQERPEPDFAVEGHTFRARFTPGLSVSKDEGRVKLSERERKALEYIRNQGQISRREYARQMGVSHETAKRDLGKLVNKGVLSMRRAGRSTVYTLIGA